MPTSPPPPGGFNDPLSRSNKGVIVRSLGIIAVLVTIAVVTSILRNGPARGTAATLKLPDLVEPQDEPGPQNPGYVGWQSCRECHEARVDECLATSHFHTCRPPRPDEMPPSFNPEQGNYTSQAAGVRFEMRRSGDEFTQTAIVETPEGEQRTTTRIDLVLGAGTADDVYLAWHDDDRMYELPVAWLWPTSAWGASHFCQAYGQGDFSREMTVRCLECHTTWVETVPGVSNQYRREGALLGVTCERCHGPGKDHVEFHRSHPDATTGSLIIKPSRLARERQIEVCTQCHSNAITHKQAPFTYRPGTPLDDHYRTQSIPHSEDDHVASQIVGLRKSKCFESSDSMTCTTCHDPHRKPTAENSGTASCAKCHQPADCTEQPDLPEAVRHNCIECHMPRRYKINVKFEIEGDNFVPPIRRYQHQIGVDEIARDEVLLFWHRQQSSPESVAEVTRLTERLVKHWLDQAQTHRDKYRYMAAIADVREALRLQETPELRKQLTDLVEVQKFLYASWAQALHSISRNQPLEAVTVLRAMLPVKPDDAEVHSKLGTLLGMLGETRLAAMHLEAVAQLDPNNASGFGVLGKLDYNDRRFDSAVEMWKKAEAIEPYLAQIQYDLGLALGSLQRFAESEPHLRKAHEIQPKRVDILLSLSNVCASRGKFDEALEAAQRARKLAETLDPASVPEINEWLQQLRVRAAGGVPEPAPKSSR